MKDKYNTKFDLLRCWTIRVLACIGLLTVIILPLYVFWWESPQMKVWRGFYSLYHDHEDASEWYPVLNEYSYLVIPEARKRLLTEEPKGKVLAAYILGQFGDLKHTTDIEPLLFHNDKFISHRTALILLEYFRDTAGLAYLLEMLGQKAEDCDSTVYDLLFEVIHNRNCLNSPEYHCEYWTSWNYYRDERQRVLDECRAWFSENGKYVEWFGGPTRDIGYWQVNEDAKKAEVPVRAWREIPEDLRNRWDQLLPEDRQQAIQEAREKVGRIMELIDKL